MARLIRMDGTGHTTLAEWTAADDAAFEAAVSEFQEQQGLGYIGTVPDGPREGDPRARAAALRRPRDHAAPDRGRLMEQALPELASVPWRQRTDARWLRRWGRIWHAWTLLYTVPFLAAGAGMLWLDPLAAPVALAAIAHAWIIPELYAFRGASVVRPKGPRNETAEPVAQGLLGDLLEPRRARAPANDRACARARRARHVAGGGGRRAARYPGRLARPLLLRPHDRAGAAAVRPRGTPAAGAARRRGGFRDGREPRLRGRPVAGPAPPAGADATGPEGGATRGALASGAE